MGDQFDSQPIAFRVNFREFWSLMKPLLQLWIRVLVNTCVDWTVLWHNFTRQLEHVSLTFQEWMGAQCFHNWRTARHWGVHRGSRFCVEGVVVKTERQEKIDRRQQMGMDHEGVWLQQNLHIGFYTRPSWNTWSLELCDVFIFSQITVWKDATTLQETLVISFVESNAA